MRTIARPAVARKSSSWLTEPDASPRLDIFNQTVRGGPSLIWPLAGLVLLLLFNLSFTEGFFRSRSATAASTVR